MGDDEILLTGRTRPPDLPHRLRAGGLELELDGPDIRRVSYRGIEVVSQVFVAFRDAAWNTLPGVVSDLRIEDGPGKQFSADFVSRHVIEALGVDAEFEGTIAGSDSGELRYDVAVTVKEPLEYNRIGLNLLHGARTYAGRPYRTWLGEQERAGTLPTIVGPQAFRDGRLDGLIEPFDRIALSPVDDVTIDISLTGDEFELEDQRNFGDSSFKIYSTPLQRPGPFRLEPGETLQQSLRVTVRDERPKEAAAAPDDTPLTLTLGAPTGRAMPPFGLGQAADDAPMSDSERARVATLSPDHLRVELVLSDGLDTSRARLDAAAAEARQLGCGLWVDLTASSDDRAILADVVRAVCAAEPQPAYLYLATPMPELPDQGESAEMLAEIRALAAEAAPSLKVGAGCYMFFADLNRAPFDGAVVEHLTFASTPTVHRADDDTVLENIDRLGDEIVAARGSLGERSLTVGPITLAARHGPYPNGPTGPDDLPARVDPRQVSLLAAALTLGYLAELAGAGADGLTFYETAGWMGVAERDDGSPQPERFLSEAGSVFPLWHVLADAAEWRGATLLESRLAPDPVFTPRLTSLAVRDDDGTHVLVASLGRRPMSLTLKGLSGSVARVRTLDAASARAAMRAPEAFRAGGDSRPVRGGTLDVELRPYAVIRVDA